MFAVILGATLMASAYGFPFLDEKVDCQVTFWSEWSMSSVWQATTKSRTRVILRYPLNGGLDCPELVEVQNIGEEERLQLTATKMVDSFFSPKTSRQSGFKRDLLVIVDSSGSISRVDFDMAKTQLGRILSNICPQDDPFSNDIHKAALLRFSNTPVEIFDFNANQNTQELIESLDKMAYSGGSTCTGDAFNYALNVLLKPSKGMRTDHDVKHEVLILTDGQSNCGLNATAEAIELQKNVDVFGLIIGSFSPSGQSELESYVSDIKSHLFNVEGFDKLGQLIDIVDTYLLKAPCLGFETGK